MDFVLWLKREKAHCVTLKDSRSDTVSRPGSTFEPYAILSSKNQSKHPTARIHNSPPYALVV